MNNIEIINNQNFITNNELLKILELVNNDYFPSKLIIYEDKKNTFKLMNMVKNNYLINLYDVKDILIEKNEAWYDEDFDVIVILVYNLDSYNEKDININDVKLEIIESLLYCMRQKYNSFYEIGFENEDMEDQDCEKFVFEILGENNILERLIH